MQNVEGYNILCSTVSDYEKLRGKKMREAKKILNNIKVSMTEGYGLALADSDIYIADKIIYIVTGSVANLFRTSHHNFSIEYVQPLINSGVRRIQIGRSKFYCLSEVLDRFKKARMMDKTIIEICRAMAERKKKTKKRKRK